MLKRLLEEMVSSVIAMMNCVLNLFIELKVGLYQEGNYHDNQYYRKSNIITRANHNNTVNSFKMYKQ